MDEDGFWKIVQNANDRSGGDMDQKCDALRQQIPALSKDDALEFARHFDAMMDKAYDWPLWGAAYVINGGCSDDTFTDFRAALISRGRQAFERALSDPDSLADEDFDEVGLVLRRLSICCHRWCRSRCRFAAATECAGSTVRHGVAGGSGRQLVSETQREIWVMRRVGCQIA